MNTINANSPLQVERVEYVEFWVGNAKISSKFYCQSFRFTHIARRGLENGHKDRTSHVINSNDATFVFTSTLRADDEEFNAHLGVHGDGVKDVALRVNNVQGIYDQAISNGARSIVSPYEVTDADGTVIMAKIAAPYGDVVHTLIDRSRYNGVFLPGFKKNMVETNRTKSQSRITSIDHIAIAYEEGVAQTALDWYTKCLGFSRFICNEEESEGGLTINGKDGGLKTVVAASNQEKYALKFVFVEALRGGNKKNQIAEFIEFNGGTSGIQHIALHSDDIIESVSMLQDNGVEFITVPKSYYDDLFAQEGQIKFATENASKLQELGILLDISHQKASTQMSEPYFLLQTFCIPLQDRPTYFFEIISRKGSRGFGQRTIKALFEAIERLQQKRTAE